MLVKPRSRSRCAEGAGREEHHQPNDNQRRSSAFSGVLISLLLSAISTMINPRRSPKLRAADAATNSYPVGSCPYQGPSCVTARAKGSKEDGTNLDTRHLSAKSGHGHASTLDSGVSSCLLQSLKLSAPRQSGSRRFAGSATEQPRACAP